MSQKQDRKEEKLAKRTVQIIGFGFAFVLIGIKLFALPDADIPWWVIGGFFGVGVSAEFNVSEMFNRGKK